jgi:hypothetical protein
MVPSVTPVATGTFAPKAERTYRSPAFTRYAGGSTRGLNPGWPPTQMPTPAYPRADEKSFPAEHACQLAAIVPDVRAGLAAGSRTWIMLDQPGRTAHLIAGLARRAAAPRAAWARPGRTGRSRRRQHAVLRRRGGPDPVVAEPLAGARAAWAPVPVARLTMPTRAAAGPRRIRRRTCGTR